MALKIDDKKAKARGRNGWFVPKLIDLWSSDKGNVRMAVFSRCRGTMPPIILGLSSRDSIKLGILLISKGFRSRSERLTVDVEALEKQIERETFSVDEDGGGLHKLLDSIYDELKAKGEVRIVAKRQVSFVGVRPPS